MLEWFSNNSIWILTASGILLVILLAFGEKIREACSRILHRKGDKTSRKGNFIFWGFEMILLGIVVLSFISITMTRGGIYETITPESIKEQILQHGPPILIISVAAIGLWYAVSRFLPLLLRRTMAKPKRGESREGMKKRADTLLAVFGGLSRAIIVILALFMILSELTVPIGPILAGFGIVGIAVGFGAQYLIRDLIAGVFILMENQYRVGDVAKIATISGLVEEITLRKTVLRDLDGIVHHVPNGEITVASNYTRHFSRVNLDISVAYGTDLDFATEVINRVCNEMAAEDNWAKVIRVTPQVLRVNNLGDSGIEIKILGEVKPLEQWNVMGELRKRIKRTFDEEGIEIPWPHVKVYYGRESASVVKCPACGQDNIPAGKFCSGCGAKLGGEQPLQGVPPGG